LLYNIYKKKNETILLSSSISDQRGARYRVRNVYSSHSTVNNLTSLMLVWLPG